MHYLAETIERKFPELLSFPDELVHVDRAARVSVDTIGKTLRNMDMSIKNLETDLTNSKVPQNADDKFTEVMSVSFLSISFAVYYLFIRACFLN